MKTTFYYELQRERPLTEREKAVIQSILAAYRIPKERLLQWNGDSCSLPVFRCFEIPMLYAEHIQIAEKETALLAAAHWCCMLDALHKALPDISITASMEEAVVYDEVHGFLIASLEQQLFISSKEQECKEIVFEQTEHREPPKESAFTVQEPLYETKLCVETAPRQDMEQLTADFEAKLHIKLPAAYRDFLIRYNAGQVVDTYFCSEQKEENAYCMERFYGFHEAETSFFDLPDQADFTSLLKKGYLCFAQDAFGNYMVMRIRGTAYGEISFYCHDDSPHFHVLSKDFFHFILQCHCEADVFHEDALTPIYIRNLKDDETDERLQAFPLDDFLEEETAADKLQEVRRLMMEPEPYEEGFLHFDSFAFRLAVIEELMYVQKLLPVFDLYEELVNIGVDPEDDFRYHGPVLMALRYFKTLPLPVELATHIESLTLDGGNDIYANIQIEWDGEDASFTIVDVQEEELKQFVNLKRVQVISMGEPSFVRTLRMRGIEVFDRFDEQDVVSSQLQHVLTEWEECCAYIDWKDSAYELLDVLRYQLGGYYRELFHPSLEEWACMREQRIEENTLSMLAEKLKAAGLTLLHYELNTDGYCLLVTRDFSACMALLKKYPKHILVQRRGVWTIKEKYQPSMSQPQPDVDTVFYRVQDEKRQQKQAAYPSEKRRSRKRMTRTQKRALLMTFAALFVLASFLIVNHIIVSNQETIWDENLNYNYRVACKGNDGGCQLQNSEGTPYFEETFQDGEPTYSSLIIIREYNGGEYDRMYDITQKKFINGEFLSLVAVDLKKNGKTLNNRGLLATKDGKNYVLYSEQHKTGINVKGNERGYVGYGPFDVDTGVEMDAG